jgi:membrane protease YdiL (CAAX protease family)
VPRALRQIVPIEILAVIAIAIAPLPDMMPVALPLFVAGTISRWVRGRSLAETRPGARQHLAIGAAVGAGSLGIVAVVAGGDITEHSIARGNFQMAMIVALVTAATAFAMEMAMRGWLVERVLELTPGSPVLPIAVGAFAEAIVTPGDSGERISAGIMGAALGWLYVASGRSVVAPIAARIVFTTGAVVLAALKLVG